jgi:hypothetical protein
MKTDDSQTSKSISKVAVGSLLQNSVIERINHRTFIEVLASIHQSNFNHGVVNCSLLLAALYVIAVFIAGCDSQNAYFALIGIAFEYQIELFFIAHDGFLVKLNITDL